MLDKSEEPSCCKRCCLPLGQEFQRSKFSLHHEEPADFCCSQWQRGDRCIIWLIYRWLLAAFFGGGVIASCVQTFSNGQWFIYLTDWGFVLCWFTCMYGAILATIYYCRPTYFAPGSFSLKFYWASHYTTTTLAMMITLVFWVALYPSMGGGAAGLYNLWAHAFNSVGMIFDCFMVAFPTRLMHFIYPFITGMIYGFFSLFYYLAGGVDMFGNRFIYFILDWSEPGLAIASICACILLVAIFCLFVFWIHQFRIWLHARCIGNKTVQLNTLTIS